MFTKHVRFICVCAACVYRTYKRRKHAFRNDTCIRNNTPIYLIVTVIESSKLQDAIKWDTILHEN